MKSQHMDLVQTLLLRVIIIAFLINQRLSDPVVNNRIEILMPKVTTTEEDAYLCTSYKIKDDELFITQIEPLTNMDIAHHMFAYGCESPSAGSDHWNCMSSPCKGGYSILYAWGRNAPTLKLPDDVAFKVGPGTKHKYIVVNIHYLNTVSNDQSGMAITFSNKPRPYFGGIMLMVTNEIHIPPKTKNYTSDISCQYDGNTINVFAFRVHAHVHGVVNTAYRIRNDKWKQIAQGDPQWPQAFYSVGTPIEILDGDILAGRCVYHNDEDISVDVGMTHNNEMCNIYLMYYSASDKDIKDTCNGNFNRAITNMIPEESYKKPSPPAGMNVDPNNHHHNTHEDPVIKQTLVRNWYDAEKIKIGQVGGLVIDSIRNNLIVFHRGSRKWEYDSFNNNAEFNTKKYSTITEDTIIVMNDGKVIKSWGANMFYMPHGITVDPMGNVWVTDVGRHQVLKFLYNETSKPVMEIGVNARHGNDSKHFCQPSDVAVLKNGDFFVADGYCNSRIVKFDKDGKYLMQWSSKSDASSDRFHIPHSLALHEDSNLICVADRENYRVQCFDLNGNFKYQSDDKEYGPIYGVSFASSNGSILYAINGYAGGESEQYEKKILLIKLSDGSIIDTIKLDKDEVVKPHDIAINSDASEIYIGTLDPPKVVKYAYPNQKTNINSVVIPSGRDLSTLFMIILGISLVCVAFAVLIIRLKNRDENGKSAFYEWINSGKNNNDTTVEFTRLNQESDNENDLHDNTNSESDEITIPLNK